MKFSSQHSGTSCGHLSTSHQSSPHRVKYALVQVQYVRNMQYPSHRALYVHASNAVRNTQYPSHRVLYIHASSAVAICNTRHLLLLTMKIIAKSFMISLLLTFNIQLNIPAQIGQWMQLDMGERISNKWLVFLFYAYWNSNKLSSKMMYENI